MLLGLQEFEVSRISRQLAHWGGNVFSLTHRLLLTSVRGWVVDPKATVRPEGWSQWKVIPFNITLLFQRHRFFLAVSYLIQWTFKFELSTYFIVIRQQDMVSKVTAVCAVQSRSRGSIPDRGRKFFSFTKVLVPPRVPGALLWAQLIRNEADYPPPSSAKIKNEWSYNSSPPYIMRCTRTPLPVRKHALILIRPFLFWFILLCCIILNTKSCCTHRKKSILWN